MKYRVRIVLLTGLIAPLLGFGSVLADNTGTDSTGDVKTVDTAEVKKTLPERLQERKDALKTKLTTVEQTRIKSKCKLSQTPLSKLNDRANEITTNRGKIHENLVSKLNDLVAKLKAQNADTSKLEEEIATLKAKIVTFQTDLASYSQAISDVTSMDCAADPTAFKASLETARTLRITVAKDAADIREYFTGTIKPTLQEIRTTLSNEKEGDN